MIPQSAGIGRRKNKVLQKASRLVAWIYTGVGRQNPRAVHFLLP
jgi:hypothetical protein